MAQFENYLDQKKKQTWRNPFEVYERQVEKNLRNLSEELHYGDDHIPYTADDMGEMFSERMQKTTYEERSRYYFTDHNYMLAKAKRYLRLSKDKRETDRFAKRYDYRDGKDRRSYAKDAGLCFGRAWEKEKKLEEERDNGRAPENNWKLYEAREAIMNDRMEGMLCAAKAKARSDVHEKYMTLRAQLSCYTILREQAERFRQKCKPTETNLIRKFDDKLKSLNGKLEKVKSSIAVSIPTTRDQWFNRLRVGVYGEIVQEEQKKKGIRLSNLSAELGGCLEQCLRVIEKRPYPCFVPLADLQGTPVSATELKKKNWNNAYAKAVKNKDRETKKRMEMEAIQRFENYEVPSLEDLKKNGAIYYFVKDPSAFMEVIFCAAPYYKAKIGSIDLEKKNKGDKHFRDYLDTHPRFYTKVALFNTIRDYFTYELLTKHHINLTKGALKDGGKDILQYTMKHGAPEDQKKYYDDRLTEAYNSFTNTDETEVVKLDASLSGSESESEKLDQNNDNLDVNLNDELNVKLNGSFYYGHGKDDLNMSFIMEEEKQDDDSDSESGEEKPVYGGAKINLNLNEINTNVHTGTTGKKREKFPMFGATGKKEDKKKEDGKYTYYNIDEINEISDIAYIEGLFDEMEKKNAYKNQNGNENLNIIHENAEQKRVIYRDKTAQELEQEKNAHKISEDDLKTAFAEAPHAFAYTNPKSGKKTNILRIKPRNLEEALEFRKNLVEAVTEKDLGENQDVMRVYSYYNLCVTQFLETRVPVFSEEMMRKKDLRGLDIEEVALLRNAFTADGLEYHELPQAAKEVYDYYDTRLRILKEKVIKDEEVTPHALRKNFQYKAFLDTNLFREYEGQAPLSNDCWSCAGSGILNHYTRNEKNREHVTQQDFRAFKPKYRSAGSMGLKLPQDQAYYDKMKADLDEFTIHNQADDRKYSVMGNPYMMSDFYLNELKKYKNLQNTAVKKAEFSTATARKNRKKDPNLLSNMAEKFKSIVCHAISKDSALTLLYGKHYVTIVGLNGDQLSVYDSQHPGALDSDTYTVSELFSPDATSATVELTWLEDVGDPKETANQYSKLAYNEKESAFTSTGVNETECIGLNDGVEAWKTFEEKEEDIRQFYSEGIYLPKKFTAGIQPKQTVKVFSTIVEKPVINKKGEKPVINKKDEKPAINIIHEKPAVNEIIEKPASDKTAKDLDLLDGFFAGTTPGETEKYEITDNLVVNPMMIEDKERREEYTNLLKSNPELTYRGYKHYRRFRDNQKILEDKGLNSLLQTLYAKSLEPGANKQKKRPMFKYKKNAALNMAAGAFLYSVRYQSDGKALKADESKEKWNKSVLHAFAEQGDTYEKEVKQKLGQVIADVQIPSPEELENGWIEKQMDLNPSEFVDNIRRMHCMGYLLQDQTWLADELQKNSFAAAKLDAAMKLGQYVENYMRVKYDFSPFDTKKGSAVMAPMKQKAHDALKKENKAFLEKTYTAAWQAYDKQDAIRREKIEKDLAEYNSILKPHAMRAGRELHKEDQKHLKEIEENKERLRMLEETEQKQYAYEKENLKREQERKEKERALEEEKYKKERKEKYEKWKTSRENPDAIRRTGDMKKIIQEVQKEKEDGKKTAPMDLKAFPTMQQLKNGWVDEMYQKHPKELIRMLQDGKDEKNELQADAHRALKTIITLEIRAKYGVQIDGNGTSCSAVEPSYDRNMKQFIDNVLAMEYATSYSLFAGLDQEKVWKDYKRLLAADKGKEEGKADDTIEAESKTRIIRKKDSKNPENPNKIHMIQEKDDSGENISDDEEEIIQKSSKKKNAGINQEAEFEHERRRAGLGAHISDKDRVALQDLNVKYGYKEKSDKLTGENMFVYNALKEVNAAGIDTKLRSAYTRMRESKTFREAFNNTYMGAASPLIQSLRNNEKNTSKIGFNRTWLMALIYQNSTVPERKKAAQDTVTQMINENLGNIFNGFELPSPEDIRKGWFEQQLKKDAFSLFEVLRKAQGVPRLMKENEVAQKYYNEHQAFARMVDACVILEKYTRIYLMVHLRINIVEDNGQPQYLDKASDSRVNKADEEMKEIINGEYTAAYQKVDEEDRNAFANATSLESAVFKIPESARIMQKKVEPKKTDPK